MSRFAFVSCPSYLDPLEAAVALLRQAGITPEVFFFAHEAFVFHSSSRADATPLPSDDDKRTASGLQMRQLRDQFMERFLTRVRFTGEGLVIQALVEGRLSIDRLERIETAPPRNAGRKKPALAVAAA